MHCSRQRWRVETDKESRKLLKRRRLSAPGRPLGLCLRDTFLISFLLRGSQALLLLLPSLDHLFSELFFLSATYCIHKYEVKITIFSITCAQTLQQITYSFAFPEVVLLCKDYTSQFPSTLATWGKRQGWRAALSNMGSLSTIFVLFANSKLSLILQELSILCIKS